MLEQQRAMGGNAMGGPSSAARGPRTPSAQPHGAVSAGAAAPRAPRAPTGATPLLRAPVAAGSSSSSSGTSGHGSGGGAGVSGGGVRVPRSMVERDLCKELAGRLEALLGENEALRGRVGFLEEEVR